ncbi:MAG: DUF2304 domain-containing protein [Nitrospirota bacterium]|nr:DUF2304 domain-containing protein [Nitrospirota bacterium]
MTAQLKILAAVIGVTLFIYIVELVRKRRLREEYAWLWMLTGLMIVVLSLWYDLLVFLGRLLGGILPSALLFFFGLLSLLLICLHLSIKLSTLTDQVKRLAQELALTKTQKGKP